MKRLALACLLLPFAMADESFADAAAPEAPVSELSRPKGEPYFDEATGVEFPAELGSLFKTQVVKNNNPFYGTVVRYAGDSGLCADVYLYTLGQEPDADALKAHFQGALKVIANLPSAGGPVKTVSQIKESSVDMGPKGEFHCWRADFSFVAVGGGRFDSEMLLFPFRGRLVKIRVSRPDGSKDVADSFERELTSLFAHAAKRPQARLPVED